MPVLKHSRSLFIGGEWRETSDAEAIINPATEEIIHYAPVGSIEDARDAVAAARHAFDHGPWPKLSAFERRTKLQQFLNLVLGRREEICALIVAEAGATVALAQTLQFAVPIKHAQYMIDHCEQDSVTGVGPEINATPGGGKALGTAAVVREPVGVVVAITPYNVPFFLNIGKVVPALAVGCTVALKPSPYTPMLALLLGEIADEAGLPRGVLNIVTGGKDVGEVLTTDARVDMVSFTGSDVVGEAIQRQTAGTLKRVVLELGGKSAMIVRADADLDAAARAGLQGFTAHCGQGCQLLTRHIVHNSVRPAYVERVAAMARALRIGNPADPTVQMGPLIRGAQRARTEEYVAIASAEGARLVTGGERPRDLEKGFFYRPTLFDDVRADYRIAQEEVFGPVGAVIGFDTDDEGIAIANDSRFGLSGSVYSADAGRAYELALQIRTGGVSINGGAGAMLSAPPFGGIRRSGYGREFGMEGMREFTYTKTISFRAA